MVIASDKKKSILEDIIKLRDDPKNRDIKTKLEDIITMLRRIK